MNGTVHLWADGVSSADIYPAAESVDSNGAVDSTATIVSYLCRWPLWLARVGGLGMGRRAEYLKGLPSRFLPSRLGLTVGYGPAAGGCAVYEVQHTNIRSLEQLLARRPNCHNM